MRLDIGAICDIGDRSENQDRALVLVPAMIFGAIDGMGGHSSGGKAAQLVWQEFQCLTHVETPSRELLMAAAKRAHQAVRQINCDKRGNKRAGAVGTIGWIDQQRYCVHIVHIGDSRVYKYRQGALQQISVDNTPLSGMAEENRIEHEGKNQINDAYGLYEQAGFSTYETSFLPGDTLMFCSDGLSDILLPICIRTTLAEDCGASEIARNLVQRVKGIQRRNKDNITVVLVRFLASESEKSSALDPNPTCCPIE